ncbi:MsnO8 family LLM class oxidoreductase [Tatumella ptyseos]|uniref:MsnO8 family LLM class oxidoreductase n=1 Tax=Tatumella ptyseos TaxID=82987 RepID=UPI0023F2E159|nr:MsnO8 family LLM class oxidoreductase [Tatumella ptyseos]
MSYQLSVLDKCPVNEGETATDALQRVAGLAQAAERWGYRRFWLAEHHNTSGLASPSPEILIAWVLAQTKHLKVGSGGVMLQHYSPYKVAENFNLLATLAPGRVDLGVGKAPGGLPLSTKALQAAQDPDKQGTFASQLQSLDSFLQLPGHPSQDEPGLRATPLPGRTADKYLLGASTDSAALASSLGWNFVFAAHLNGDRSLLRTFSDYWQAETRLPVIIAVQVIVSEDGEEARRQAAQCELWQVELVNGRHVTVGSEAQADSFIRQSEVAVKSVSRKETAILAGDAREVLSQLEALHQEFSVSEFMLDLPLSQPEIRINTLRLLAQEREHSAARQVSPVTTESSVA